MNKEARVEKALDTLAEICDMDFKNREARDGQYERRAAAEEILRHYRETELLKNLVITVKMEGHVPVRPVERARTGE